MAKLSISNLLIRKHRIRILTLAAAIIVGGFLIQLIIAKNPKDTKAVSCLITPGSPANIPANCENGDVTIDGQGSTTFTVDAGDVKVWQTSGTRQECNFSTNQPNQYTGRCGPSNWMYLHVVPYTKGTACTTDHPDCDSKRSFNTLTIRNGAILTHAAVTTDEALQRRNDTITIADDVAGTGRWKKVDIEVAGNVSIESGAKIDVTGKGYPGGFVQNCESLPNPATPLSGYGPGGGLFSGVTASWGFGAGGAYFGNGGDADQDNDINNGFIPNTGGIGYYNEDVFDFGSGGGSGCGDWRETQGGAGGGRIRIASYGSVYFNGGYVYANGAQGTYSDGVNNESSGGGGGGGDIRIGGMQIYLPEDFKTDQARGTLLQQPTGTTATNGRAFIDYTPVNIENTNHFYDTPGDKTIFTARGGLTWKRGAGGGGSIWVGLPNLPSGATIRKTLWPVYREPNPVGNQCVWNWAGNPLGLAPTPSDAANPNCAFDPYNLRRGDKIEVSLTVSNAPLNQELKITDQVLHNDLAYCDPDDNSATSNLTAAFDSYPETVNGLRHYTFDVANNTDETVQFRYTCEVK